MASSLIENVSGTESDSKKMALGRIEFISQYLLGVFVGADILEPHIGIHENMRTN